MSDTEIESLVRCTKCSLLKPEYAFRLRNRSDCPKPIRVKQCLKCERAANRIRMKVYNKRKWVTQYGLTWDSYQELLDSQSRKCAACEAELDCGPNTHIDHCHRTGKVRGILCRSCNIALGLLDDDKDRVSLLLNYIERQV